MNAICHRSEFRVHLPSSLFLSAVRFDVVLFQPLFRQLGSCLLYCVTLVNYKELCFAAKGNLVTDKSDQLKVDE